jgi:hypothetical protein
VIAAAPATLNPAPRTCTSRRISVVRHVRDGGEGRAGDDGGAQIGEAEGGKGRGAGWMHIHSARGISDNGALVGDDGQCTTVVGADAGQGHNGALVDDDG